MLNRPELLLLDEPTASLDPATAQEVRARIRKSALEGEGGVLWTSHNMLEVQDCDRVLFLSHGKILLEGDPKRLPTSTEKKRWKSFLSPSRGSRSLWSGCKTA